MQYPHRLMVAGGVLVVLGSIGLALRQESDVDLDDEQTEIRANGKQDVRDSNPTTFPPWPRRSPPPGA